MTPIGSHVVFHVSNLEKSLDFYSEKLGFCVDCTWGNPTTYAGLRLGMVCLHMSSSYPYINHTGHGHLYIMVERIDDIYDNLVKAHVEFYSPIADREYGMRDFSIKDLDGNQIGIGATIQRHPSSR